MQFEIEMANGKKLPNVLSDIVAQYLPKCSQCAAINPTRSIVEGKLLCQSCYDKMIREYEVAQGLIYPTNVNYCCLYTRDRRGKSTWCCYCFDSACNHCCWGAGWKRSNSRNSYCCWFCGDYNDGSDD